MRSEWDDPALAEPWAAAMGAEGDYWRRVLINPIVLAIAERTVAGGDPFGSFAFTPPARAREGEAAALAGLRVVDLGCGEGCLGRVVAARGASYFGLDGSRVLLEIAARRAAAAGLAGQMAFAHAELEHDAAAALAAAGPAGLVTAHVVLDHMAEVSGLLAATAAWLQKLRGEVPFLCVTLAPERFEPSLTEVAGPGEFALSRPGLIESCQREVTIWLRSRRVFERAFRDAGLFVRRCEPLFFHRAHAEAPAEQREDASRRPVFWAWLLSARQGTVAALDRAVFSPGTDATALYASVEQLAASAPRPRIFDFQPGEPIIRVHNMGGELFALLSGSARMMDHGQELMTFRAGEVLGDLETPDGSGQCGSFPFDVVAADEGCRVAIFTEATASAVLAQSRDVGSRFFRLLRDRLRLALWHYDIREIVGEYLERGERGNERLEKRLLHRCARALLWAAAIEGRGRARTLAQEVAFLDPETIARRFKPGTERIDFGVVIRQLHLLRMIDAFPGAALRKEEEAGAAASWDALVARATERYLLGETTATAQIKATVHAHAGRIRVGGQLSKDGNPTRQFQDVQRDLEGLVGKWPDGPLRLQSWSAYIARAHRFWEDRNPWLVVLRDVPALRRIALGDASGIEEALASRAEYLLHDARRPTWELVTAQTVPARRREYVAVFDAFVVADLARDGRLGFSSEGALG